MKGSWIKVMVRKLIIFFDFKILSHCCHRVLGTINKHFTKTCNMILPSACRRSRGEARPPLSGASLTRICTEQILRDVYKISE